MFIKMNEKLKIFLPSSGSLSKGSLDYFEKSELIISKESDRKLIGKINGSDSIEIYFQRSGDIPIIIDRGSRAYWGNRPRQVS